MKRALTLLFILVLSLGLAMSALADVIYEPEDDFFQKHRDECYYENRVYIASGENGYAAVMKNPKSNTHNAGFTREERDKMTTLLSSGFVDTWRSLNPGVTGVYSWWSYRFHARENNSGWRIDYFIISEALRPRLQNAAIHTEIYGSDHCPVELVLSD